MRSYWTYILASKPRGTLYIGVTNGLIFRVEQHRYGKGSAFTRKYGVHMLVWYEEFADVRQAIQREKTLKEARDAFERAFILAELRAHEGNVTRTAEKLGIERSHLYRKLKGYGITPPKS